MLKSDDHVAFALFEDQDEVEAQKAECLFASADAPSLRHEM